MMSAECLAASINALAISIAQDKSVNELSLLAASLTQLGDTLATIATQRSICEELLNDKNNNK